jgi:acylaminoacyl-peptidase
VNFRGSLGFGQALIDFLPGKCGTEDIKDTMVTISHSLMNLISSLRLQECMKDALSKQLADPNKAVLCGGSHGGFIGAHIVTQSNAFKAAVLRYY